MPKYEILINRTQIASVRVEIHAETKEKAEAAVLDAAHEYDYKTDHTDYDVAFSNEMKKKE